MRTQIRSTANMVGRGVALGFTASLVFVLVIAWPQSLHGAVAYVQVSGHSMDPTYHTGDVVMVRHAGSYARGEVIAYRIPAGEAGAGVLVIHRIVGGDGQQGFVTRGDNRTADDLWRPRAHDVVGAAWIVLPQAARVLGSLRTPLGLALLGGILAAFASHAVLAGDDRARARGVAVA